jgi:hypothetical protein
MGEVWHAALCWALIVLSHFFYLVHTGTVAPMESALKVTVVTTRALTSR